jgi:predicted esterase
VDKDGIDFRCMLLEAMLAGIDTSWPQAKGTWSFATAGLSGGAGYASHQADVMTVLHRRVIGMLLMNGGYSPDMWDKYVKGPKAPMRKVPVFYSAGQTDDVCKPEIMKNTIQQAKKGGFRRLREEWHPGGHSAHTPHITEALQWFESEAAK